VIDRSPPRYVATFRMPLKCQLASGFSSDSGKRKMTTAIRRLHMDDAHFLCTAGPKKHHQRSHMLLKKHAQSIKTSLCSFSESDFLQMFIIINCRG